MKKIILLLPLFIAAGCSSIPQKSVQKLPEVNTNGTGALAIATSFFGRSEDFPCQRFYLNMHKKIAEQQVSEEFIKLNFFPSSAQYVLFDNIQPGSYVIKEIKCFPKHGYVFNKNKRYLKVDAWNEFEVAENKVTLSKSAFYGTTYLNKRFDFKFNNQEDNVTLLKRVVKLPSDSTWSFYNLEPKLSSVKK